MRMNASWEIKETIWEDFQNHTPEKVSQAKRRI
jgi:hypothetical protein